MILMIITSFYLPIKHIFNLYTFPLIQLDGNFMVITQPFQIRYVYNLNKISLVKPFLKSVFFLHNGFPVLINLHALPESERNQFIDTICTGYRISQNGNVDTLE